MPKDLEKAAVQVLVTAQRRDAGYYISHDSYDVLQDAVREAIFARQMEPMEVEKQRLARSRGMTWAPSPVATRNPALDTPEALREMHEQMRPAFDAGPWTGPPLDAGPEVDIDKAIIMATNGLCTDGGMHKQWCLQRVIELLGGDLTKIQCELQAQGYDFDEGVAP